jgi:hypothetical protein
LYMVSHLIWSFGEHFWAYGWHCTYVVRSGTILVLVDGKLCVTKETAKTASADHGRLFQVPESLYNPYHVVQGARL